MNDYIAPMTHARRIIFITYDGAELLDLTGPAAVFSTAAQLAGEGLYCVAAASIGGGLVRHACGLAMDTLRLDDLAFGPTDTILIIGAYEAPLKRAAADRALHDAMRRAAEQAERFGSVCTGAFILGAAGLLDGRRVATHWMARRALQSVCADARVEDDALYVEDGGLWTSAGVTTGIDMALAMIARDHGSPLKAKVARQLVVYSHRPGRQAQFSDVLEAQSRGDARFSGLVDWLIAHIDQPIRVEDMAERAGMSPRTFQRRFSAIYDQSPARFFERLRLDRARQLIEAGEPVKSAAPRVGFRSEAAFRSAFKHAFGVTPRHYAQMRR